MVQTMFKRIPGRRSDGDRGAAVLHGVRRHRRDAARHAAGDGGDVSVTRCATIDVTRPSSRCSRTPPATPRARVARVTARPQRHAASRSASPSSTCCSARYFLIVVYPMFWLFYTSLKPDREIFLHPFRLPDPANLHVAELLQRLGRRAFSSSYFFNSVLHDLYDRPRHDVPRRDGGVRGVALHLPAAPRPIFFYFLAGLMIPIQLAIVPLFFQLQGVGPARQPPRAVPRLPRVRLPVLDLRADRLLQVAAREPARIRPARRRERVPALLARDAPAGPPGADHGRRSSCSWATGTSSSSRS